MAHKEGEVNTLVDVPQPSTDTKADRNTMLADGPERAERQTLD